MLDGHAAASGDFPEIVGVELLVEGFGRQAGQQRMLVGIAGRVVQAAEATRVVESQRVARVEQQVEVIVSQPRRCRRHDPQAARHPEVQHQSAGFGFQQKILGPALRVQDAIAGNARRDSSVDTPSQSRFVDGEGDDAASHRVRLDTAARGLDLWKFRHAQRVR